MSLRISPDPVATAADIASLSSVVFVAVKYRPPVTFAMQLSSLSATSGALKPTAWTRKSMPS